MPSKDKLLDENSRRCKLACMIWLNKPGTNRVREAIRNGNVDIFCGLCAILLLHIICDNKIISRANITIDIGI